MANTPTAGHKRPLRKVVVVFKTHFDLGFTDLPDRVMEQYTGPMFRAVMDVMDATASEPPDLRYRWVLPAWPMKQFLQGPDVPAETRARARALVEEGRLRWRTRENTYLAAHTSGCKTIGVRPGREAKPSLRGCLAYPAFWRTGRRPGRGPSRPRN